MALTKKTYIIIFVAVLVVIGISVALYYIFRGVSDPNKSNTPVPPGSPSTTWVKETFPLNVGMYGLKIKALQKAMGFSTADQDGRLGSQTKAGIIAKGKSVPLSQSDYYSIVSPPVDCIKLTKIAIDNWVIGKPVYALFGRVVKELPDNNSDTLVNIPKCGNVGIYRGKADVPGWVKVDVYAQSQTKTGYITQAAVSQFVEPLNY